MVLFSKLNFFEYGNSLKLGCIKMLLKELFQYISLFGLSKRALKLEAPAVF